MNDGPADWGHAPPGAGLLQLPTNNNRFYRENVLSIRLIFNDIIESAPIYFHKRDKSRRYQRGNCAFPALRT